MSIDWSEIPEDVTHYDKEQNLWYRKGPARGQWQYKEPFNNFDWETSVITADHAERLIARPVELTTASTQCPVEALYRVYLTIRDEKPQWANYLIANQGGKIVWSELEPVRIEKGRPFFPGYTVESICKYKAINGTKWHHASAFLRLAAKCVSGETCGPIKPDFLNNLTVNLDLGGEATAFPPSDKEAWDCPSYHGGADDKLVREAIAAGVRRLMPAEKEAEAKPGPTHEELVLEIGRLAHEKCHLEALVDDFQRQVEMLFNTQNRLVEQLTDSLTATPGYERLVAVLKAAHDQAAMGKGADRHANGLPFHKQRMQQISVLLDSPYGMAYQVAKKVAEGLDLPTHDRQVAELYGAINYIAGIVIFLEDKLAGGDE